MVYKVVKEMGIMIRAEKHYCLRYDSQSVIDLWMGLSNDTVGECLLQNKMFIYISVAE